MGHKHSKEEILEGALRVAYEEGLSRLSFGRVAKQLATSDRVVVYYFATKDDLVGAVLTSLSINLLEILEPVMVSDAPDHTTLVRFAWPQLTSTSSDATFALFFEAVGLAAAGREPYATLVPQLVEAFIEWASTLIQGPPKYRLEEAAATIATLDGLLLLRQLAGPEMAARAAARLTAGS